MQSTNLYHKGRIVRLAESLNADTFLARISLIKRKDHFYLHDSDIVAVEVEIVVGGSSGSVGMVIALAHS